MEEIDKIIIDRSCNHLGCILNPFSGDLGNVLKMQGIDIT
jgi:hypothetical protein